MPDGSENPMYSSDMYDVRPQDLAIGGLIAMGAFAAVGVVALATATAVAAPTALATTTIDGMTYIGALTTTQIAEITAANAAIDLAIATGTAIPIGATDVLTTALTNLALTKAGIVAIAALLNAAAAGVLDAYGLVGGATNENSEIYNGTQGVLTTGFWPGTTNSISAVDRSSGLTFNVIVGESYGYLEN